MADILFDSVLDCLKLLPFLYLSYLAVEYAEHKMSEKTKEMIYKAGKAGPLIGALVGIIPQCGFSAAAAGLFAGGMISPGTLIAVFLSTSDEMLPIMLSEHIPMGTIGRILFVKVIAAAAIGLLTDLAIQAVLGKCSAIPEHPEMCEHENCGCGQRGIWRSALSHTLQTAWFIFIVTLGIGAVMEYFGLEGVSGFLNMVPGIPEVLAALVGMIPNCAASVFVTELYLEGVLGAGALFAGLLCSAGTGLLVLWKENRRPEENTMLTVILYIGGLAAGLLAGWTGIL